MEGGLEARLEIRLLGQVAHHIQEEIPVDALAEQDIAGEVRVPGDQEHPLGRGGLGGLGIGQVTEPPISLPLLTVIPR